MLGSGASSMRRLGSPEVAYPVATVVFALAVILPLLGSFGLWQPHEIALADAAMQLGREGGFGDVYGREAPLGPWLAGGAVKFLGTSELAVRLPFALLALVTVGATYGIGNALRGPRAGAVAAFVLLSTPLFVFESRQLLTDVPLMCGNALAIWGYARLAYRVDALGADSRARRGLSAALLLAGLVMGFLARGVLFGVSLPLAAMTLASFGFRAGDDASPRRLSLMGWILAAATLLSLALAMVALFDIVAAMPTRRGVFGYTLSATKGYVPLLGAEWLRGPAADGTTTDFLIGQMGFGMFPWSAVAPWAMLYAASRARTSKEASGGMLLVGWAGLALVIASIWIREIGFVRYPALPAMAVAIAVVLDELLEPDEASWMPLAALFTLAAGIQLVRDLSKYPEELLAVHVAGDIEFPDKAGFLPVALALGAAVAVSAALLVALPALPAAGHRLWLRVRPWLMRTRWFAVALCVPLGAYWSWVFLPSVSEHLSYKNVFQAARAHRDREPLGVMGMTGSGPEYYAGPEHDKLSGRSQLVEFLGRSERVLAIAPSSEICALAQEARTRGFPYHVLDADNSRFFLYTNALGPNERDRNPLDEVFSQTKPEGIKTPMSVNFDDTFELVGVTMPERAKRGGKFTVRLYFKVLKRTGTDYQIFAHFDGRGVRFQGDHDPIAGQCGTRYWPDDTYVTDTFEVKAGSVGHPRTTYDVWVGFYTGSAGRYRNLDVKDSDRADDDHRVKIGTIKVR